MKNRILRIALGSVLLTAGVLFKGKPALALYIISYCIMGYDVVLDALMSLKNKHILDENFLMSVATLGAFALGEYTEAVAVMLFFQVGEAFQSYAVNKSRKQIKSICELRADYANLLTDGRTEKVSPEDIEPGQTIVVFTGEKVPLDGIVKKGDGVFDTKAITGETLPVSLAENDSIYSGYINTSGTVEIEVTKSYDESSVAKILELVENSSEKKSKKENFITSFSVYYTPLVVVSALILSFGVPFFAGDFKSWLYRGLLFLVVSCPCALVISVPLAFFGGIGACAKKGILVKGGIFLETLANLKAVCFDKTGTLTEGDFEIKSICAQNGFEEEEILKYVASAEKHSSHPLAVSIMKYYGDKELFEVSELKEHSGKGIECFANGKHIVAGNSKLVTTISKEQNNNLTAVHLSIDGVYAGCVSLKDKIKSDAKETIEKLNSIGVRNFVMLTGDNRHSAEDVGKELKMSEVYSELLPQNKVEIFEDIQRNSKGNVCYVGDGINDAPVIARADVGVALGAIGSDSAIEAADIVIMTESLQSLYLSVKIAKKTIRIARQNIAFALIAKFSILVLGAFGYANMWAAIFADVGVAFITILNSMRSLVYKN